MTTYRRFIETNDSEGETWSWWLQVEGNELELDRLSGFLASFYDSDDVLHGVAEDVITGPEVDLLVRFADVGYYRSQNKVDGFLSLPDDLAAAFVDDLYKGGIRDLFTVADAAESENR